MPKYTIFHVVRGKNMHLYQGDDSAQIVLSRIAAQIHSGSFVPRTDVDFANEADVIKAQSDWALFHTGARVIVEYERIDNNNISVLGFQDITPYKKIDNYQDYFYRYNQPLVLNREQPSPIAGLVPEGVAEIRRYATPSTSVTPAMPAKVEPKPINNLVKEHIIQAITEQKNSYDQRINGQFWGSMRQGAKKNILVQAALDDAIQHIKKDDFSSARAVISELKEKLGSEFGKNNVFGKKSESFKLVESIEMKLTDVANQSNVFKKRLDEIKEAGQQTSAPNNNLFKPSFFAFFYQEVSHVSLYCMPLLGFGFPGEHDSRFWVIQFRVHRCKEGLSF